MARSKGDPYWITARHDDECSGCHQPVKRGERAFYYPRNRTLMCRNCGEDADARFRSEVWDEENNLCM